MIDDPWASDNMLSNGWMEVYDAAYNNTYYYNTVTKVTSWDIPEDAVEEDDFNSDGTMKKLKLKPLTVGSSSRERQIELKKKLEERKKKKSKREIVEAKKRYVGL